MWKLSCWILDGGNEFELTFRYKSSKHNESDLRRGLRLILWWAQTLEEPKLRGHGPNKIHDVKRYQP